MGMLFDLIPAPVDEVVDHLHQIFRLLEGVHHIGGGGPFVALLA